MSKTRFHNIYEIQNENFRERFERLTFERNSININVVIDERVSKCDFFQHIKSLFFHEKQF